MKKQSRRVCFAASSGGHLEELLMLRPLMERYDSFLVTEKTAYGTAVGNMRCYWLMQVNRREKSCIPRLFVNGLYAVGICLKEQPDIIVTTGVLAVIPLCLVCKALGKKLVFIESFANVKTPTMSGRLLYRFADRFYIQWPGLQEYYPEARYLGSIY